MSLSCLGALIIQAGEGKDVMHYLFALMAARICVIVIILVTVI